MTRRPGFALAVLFFFFLSRLALAFDYSHLLFKEALQGRIHSGLVDYATLKTGPENLRRYIADLESATEKEYETWTQEQRLAFWMNAYNAAVLKLIVDHYPVKSIKEIGFPFGPWKKKIMTLLGKPRSLDDIEHDILRKEFDEPRIHFALVCASLGCPDLQPEPYTAKNLEIQLEYAGRSFLRDPYKIKVDHGKKVIFVSKIFQWYGEDFVKKYGGLENGIKKYLSDANRNLLERQGYQIDFLPYNWNLNAVNPP